MRLSQFGAKEVAKYFHTGYPLRHYSDKVELVAVKR